MLGANIVVAGALCFLMGQAENTPCSLRKPLHASHKIDSPEPGLQVLLARIVPKKGSGKVPH
jgi:hypothetical protein